MGFFEPLFLQPFVGCGMEYFLEVTLEGREAATTEVSETVEVDVEPEVVRHEFFQVYFSGLAEVKQ